MLFWGTTLDGLQMGLCFAVLALGLYISFSILDFPDLSIDGAFPLGGVFCTALLFRLNLPPLLAVVLSFLPGLATGALTGFLHVKCKVSKLLSGIIVMTGLSSVTLACTKLLSATGYTTTIFSYKGAGLNGLFGGRTAGLFGKGGKDFAVILILLLFVLVIKVLEDRFLRTKLGYMLVAVGENEQWVISMGKDAGKYKILGLSLAGGLTAVSGALYTQLFSSYDNNCGSGKAVLALASVMVGLSLFGKGKGEGRDTTAVILGAILYSLCLNYLVLIDKEGIYLKLLNAVLFALILIFNDKLSNIRRVLAHRKTEVSSYAGTDGN